MTNSEIWCRLTVFRPDGSRLGRWTLRGPGTPDLATVDRLARLRLQMERSGSRVQFDGVAPALAELMTLAGLGDLLDGLDGL